MTNYRRTGKMKRVNRGLVDYVAEGEYQKGEGGEWIPCEIGYCIWGYTYEHPDERPEEELEVTHIFIKEGITKNGNHYSAQTIQL